MRWRTWGILLGLMGAALVTACGDDGGAGGGDDAGPIVPGEDAGPGQDGGPIDDPDGGSLPLTARVLPTNGSAIALTSDDAYAVAANRQAGTITVLRFTPGPTPLLEVVADFDVGASEPWSVVIGNDDDTAYVILREAQQVVRIDDLRGTPALAPSRATTGSEPTGIAISPTGRALYVAEWAEGRVSVIDAATMSRTSSIDLNAALVATGVLGPTAVARPALAHPRALVITNDGDTDDDDEQLFVTEYFAQDRVGATLPTDESRFDVAKQGIVYRVALGAPSTVTTISLSPVDDTGFVDSAGNDTGCFPNQLQTLALDSGRLHVGALCASPRGPTGGAVPNFKTEVHTAIFAIDVATGTELPESRLLLTRAFTDRYDAAGTPDDASRRIPLIATDLAFIRAGRVGYVTAYGSDAVFRFVYGDDGRVTEVGSAANSFINLAPAGRLPLGIAISRGATVQALVLNEATRNVSILAFQTQSVVSAVPVTAMPSEGSDAAHVLEGRRLFVTGLGRWSLNGQSWNSCESCHGDGLTDNVTWYFARGPRQSTSLDGSYDSADPTERRVFNWTGIFDETHDFELNTRGNSGGVGAIVHATTAPPVAADRFLFDGTTPVPDGQVATTTPQAGLNGSTQAMMPGAAGAQRSVLPDWDRIDAYVRTIRAPHAPTSLNAADVAAGRALFEANNCAGCHGTSMWTISRVFYTPSEANNHPVTGLLRSTTYTADAAFPATLNPATAGAGRTASLRFPAGPTAGANDQIQCVLRSVGTFPGSGSLAVAPEGVVASEVRQDMTTIAQGASGYNPPSLLGMVTGAPYFHAGNARTLEEVFATTFRAHHTAMSVNFLIGGTRDQEVRQMVAFLLSIDETSTPVDVPSEAQLGYDATLCPDAF
ncbi:lactonase family protein [Sandaracinus amylolyticus]|uniref:lactonase family protein n=1 Tax=Sandaracinus amylolyticus TaxID=927083 RepID=UPI001F249C97|nr:lactonase family protein [Sandaracinus amylolyticus]UJR85469.1 Hypothetical protein I5071_75490 [Sandaracinus amylolyticus]